MTPPARRDGTPDKRKKDDTFYLSYAKPAKKQHVRLDKRRENAEKNEPNPLDDNWWDDDPAAAKAAAEGVRLQKVLAQAGVASRRHAEAMIEQGRVEVNGTIVTRQGMRVNPNVDIIRVDGARINVNEEHEYFAFNKPRGVHSTMKDEMDLSLIHISEPTRRS